MKTPNGGSRRRKRKPASASREASAKPDRDRDRGELDVLDERRLERVAPVVRAASRCRTSRSCDSQRLPWPKFGITGPPAASRRPSPQEVLAGRHAERPAVGVRHGERVACCSQRGARARRGASSPPGRAAGRRPRRLPSSSSPSVRSASAFSARSAPTNSATKSSAGCVEDRRRRVVLREPTALAQDRDPVADLDRLVDVVRDEDDRLAHLVLQAEELVLQSRAHDRVDRAERLVHQHQRRVRGERTCEARRAGARRPESCAGIALAVCARRGRRARAAPRARAGSARRGRP